LKVCSLTGEGFSHSKEELLNEEKMEVRELEIPSQMIHINIMIEMNEIRDPKEEITFQVVKASG
jgi:predicted nucleic acid-binding protein